MSYKNNFISVVIVAAGLGKRMKSDINKQYLLLKEKPIVAHTIEKFENNKYIDEIIVVTKEEEMEYCRVNVVEKYNLRKVKDIISGGVQRQDSVYNGLKNCNENTKVVLIHDGVRPFIKDREISDIIKETLDVSACVTGVRVKDTIKIVDDKNNIIDTPNRENLWAVHTPQSFLYDIVLNAHNKCKKEGWIVTDDSMLVEKLGVKVKMIEGSYDNIKITTPEDIYVAESILERELKR